MRALDSHSCWVARWCLDALTVLHKIVKRGTLRGILLDSLSSNLNSLFLVRRVRLPRMTHFLPLILLKGLMVVLSLSGFLVSFPRKETYPSI